MRSSTLEREAGAYADALWAGVRSPATCSRRERRSRRAIRVRLPSSHWPPIAGGSGGFNHATGAVAIATATGNQDIALGFSDGKAIWLWLTANTTGDTDAADMIFSMGISDGNNHGLGLGEYSWAAAVQDGLAVASNANRYYDNKALVIIDNLGALTGACTASFSGSNLRLNWTAVPGVGKAYILHYVVLGGPDLKNARVINTFTAQTSVTTINRTGFGFDPDFAYYLTSGDENAAPNGRVNVSCSWGAAANKPTRNAVWCYIGSEDNVATENSIIYMHNADAGVGATHVSLEHKVLKAGAYSGNGVVQIDAWITDGFTENWIQKAGNAFHYGVLALRGLQYDIQIDLVPTVATNPDSQTGFGFSPEIIMHAIGATQSGFTGGLDITMGYGAVHDAGGVNCCWIGDANGAATSNAHTRTTAFVPLFRKDATSLANDYVAAQVSLDPDGFTFNVSTAPAVAVYQVWMAFAPPYPFATIYPQIPNKRTARPRGVDLPFIPPETVIPPVTPFPFETTLPADQPRQLRRRRPPPEPPPVQADIPFVPPVSEPRHQRVRQAPPGGFDIPADLTAIELPSFVARPRPAPHRPAEQVQTSEPLFPVESIAPAQGGPRPQRRQGADNIGPPTTAPEFPVEVLQHDAPRHPQTRLRPADNPSAPIGPTGRLRKAFTHIRLNVFRRVRRRL